MVAVHTWDMHGAASSAHRCVGVLPQGRLPLMLDPRDVPGRDLVDVIEGLVALTD